MAGENLFGSCASTSSTSVEVREKFPQLLNTSKQSHFVDIMKDKLTLGYVGRGEHSHDVGCAQANLPIPRRESLYYFEMKVLSCGARG